MEIPSKSILVPVDFTDKAEFAFQHALIMAKYIKREIVLLHIIKKDNERTQALVRLEEWAKNMEQKYGHKAIPIIQKGNIFKGLKKAALEINALVIIMGLHNPKRALKTIIGSNIPFYLVQASPQSEKIKDIVVPFDYNEKARVQLNWVVILSKYFGCNINIIKPFIESNARNEKMKNNMYFIKKVLEEKGIVYGVRTSKRGVKFNDAIYDFAKEINADLIFIMSYNFKKFILKASKYDSKIPVLCINPATNTMILPGKY
ncbi:MAG: universal stress protein [Bacteroidales bacterium]